MKRVLMICYYFPPLGGIASLRALRFAKYLPAAGWTPTVIAPREGSYYLDPTLDDTAVDVIRTWSLEISRIGRRALGTAPDPMKAAQVGPGSSRIRDAVRRWIYRPDAQVGWYPFALRAARTVLRARSFDAVFSSSVPVTSHLIGRAVARQQGLPWIAEFRDPWTELMEPADSRRVVSERMERSLVGDATVVVTPSAAWAELFRRKGAKAAVAITNGFDPSEVPRAAAPRSAVFTHMGNYYPSKQDLSAVWRALRQLRDSKQLQGLTIRFVGDLHPAVREELEAHSLVGHVEVTGFLPHREALARLSESTALLVSGAPDERLILQGMIPAKIFEYLATGLPIVYCGDPRTDAAMILAAQPGCFIVAPGDDATPAILQSTRNGSVERSLDSFSSQTLTRTFAGVLNAATGRMKSP